MWERWEAGVNRSVKHDGKKEIRGLVSKQPSGREIERGKQAGVYKIMHAGGDWKSNGVGIIVSEEITKDVLRVVIVA